jgi:hypothetical protein
MNWRALPNYHAPEALSGWRVVAPGEHVSAGWLRFVNRIAREMVPE